MTKSIGQTAREVILANPGMKNIDLLAKVKEVHPEGKTTVACIAWYKNDLRKKGITALVSTQEVTRTSEMIQAEINELQAELEMVKEEEEAAKLATIEQDLATLTALAEKLGIALPETTVQH